MIKITIEDTRDKSLIKIYNLDLATSIHNFLRGFVLSKQNKDYSQFTPL